MKVVQLKLDDQHEKLFGELLERLTRANAAALGDATSAYSKALERATVSPTPDTQAVVTRAWNAMQELNSKVNYYNLSNLVRTLARMALERGVTDAEIAEALRTAGIGRGRPTKS